jgi:hypothetical protein
MKNKEKLLQLISKEKIENLFEKIGLGVDFDELKIIKRKISNWGEEGTIEGFDYRICNYGRNQASKHYIAGYGVDYLDKKRYEIKIGEFLIYSY